jgi:hypothetical protein
MNMKLRYRLFLRRKSVYYAFDDTTKTFTSLKTKDKAEANRLLMAMNEAGKQPAMNLSLARVYLRHSDPMVSVRTWQNVLDEIIGIKTGPTQARWKSAAKDKAFDLIRDRILIETQAEHFLAVLRAGTVSTNAFLRKVHNFALDMNWLPATVIPRRQWPAIHYKEKRAITIEEHQKIIAAEVNPERNRLYQLCWHLGASQGDIANLKGEDVDWTNNTVSLDRRACAGASGRRGAEPVPRPSRRRSAVPVSVPRACWRPRHRIRLTLPPAWHFRRHASQLPLRLGRTRQDCRLSRTIRAGGFGPQQQGRASRLRETRPDENSVLGRI